MVVGARDTSAFYAVSAVPRITRSLSAPTRRWQLRPCWGKLILLIQPYGLEERRDMLNCHLPSRALAHKPPVEAYPQAIHSGRSYRPEWEEELLSLEQVCSYLAQERWFRSIHSMASLMRGGYRYYLGKRFADHSVAIGFNPDTMALICQPEGGEKTFQVPIQGITKAELMGKLAVLQDLPIYRLALTISLAAA